MTLIDKIHDLRTSHLHKWHTAPDTLICSHQVWYNIRQETEALHLVHVSKSTTYFMGMKVAIQETTERRLAVASTTTTEVSEHEAPEISL